MDIQNVGFLAKTLTLASPTPADLMSAYQKLSTRGSVAITCAPADLGPTLLAAENAGFFGMRVDGTTITAHKGKEGPCYDTGRTARYLGCAAAVLDDDNHLLSGTLRVCEKTARLYGSDAYRGCLDVTEADPSLLARLDKDPAPFDCDTFEADARKLAESLADRKPALDGLKNVFYPGPFKLLILSDGTMVRRGKRVLLPPDQAAELERRDGAWVDRDLPQTPQAPENYPDRYKKEGAACLLGDLSLHSRSEGKADFDALDEIPPAMKRRLLAVLSRNEEYFILTGSDPAQKDGCCPSNDVGLANRLVQAGILESYGAGSNSDCPVTLYAFFSEIRAGIGKPKFVRADGFRAAVQRRLESGPRWSRKAAFRLSLMAVLAAAVVILAVVLLRQVRG